MTTTTDRPASMRVTLDPANYDGQNSNQLGRRPPAAWLPDSLTTQLEAFDRFSHELDQAQIHQRYLADVGRDNEAELADREANAAARRAGKAPKSASTHRDKLTADRRQVVVDIASLQLVLTQLTGELGSARVAAAEDPVWRAHVADTRATAVATLDALMVQVDALVHVEAVDDWLTLTGPAFKAKTAIFVVDLVTELSASRGVHRDTAGAIELRTVLTRLRDNL